MLRSVPVDLILSVTLDVVDLEPLPGDSLLPYGAAPLVPAVSNESTATFVSQVQK